MIMSFASRGMEPAAAQNVGGTLVIPIVNDMFEKIDISITGYTVKKAAGFDSAPPHNVMGDEHRGCVIDDVWKIEDDTAKFWMSFQNRSEDLGCSTAYVDNETNSTEVDRCDDGSGMVCGKQSHGIVMKL
jgi:hypothetical protein